MHASLLLAVIALGGAQIYQWVDPSGQRHYSDVPHPGWEPVTLDVPRPSGTTPLAVEPPPRPAAPADPGPASLYESLEIRSPGQEETLWNIEGQLDVVIEVRPPLEPGHSLLLYLNDRQVAILGPGATVARLSEVFRGEHTLRVDLLDSGNRRLLQSPPVRFFVQQTTLLSPQSPLAPPQ